MLGIYCRTSVESDNFSIEQQKSEGIKFAVRNSLEHKIFSDSGVSGYKIDEEDLLNPYKNRPEFCALMNSIDDGTIDGVWVIEQSRISREPYQTSLIFHIFKIKKIKLFIKDKEVNFSDDHEQLIQSLSAGISNIERGKIVERTYRGLRDSINRGNRGQCKLYGYEKDGRNDKGKTKWKPMKKELKDVEFCYKQFLSGKSLRSIATDLFNIDRKNNADSVNCQATIRRWISHCYYTGKNLNFEGIQILNKFKRGEVGNIEVLSDEKKYWTACKPYPIEIISVNDWIKVVEKLQLNKIVKREQMETHRNTDKSLSSGLISCSKCDGKFFHFQKKYKDKVYSYYKHIVKISNAICKHNPKTLSVASVDGIFENFFFFFFVVFNQSDEFIQETLEKIKLEILAVEHQIKKEENEVAENKKNTEKFNKAFQRTDDADKQDVILGNLAKLKRELSEKMETLPNLKIELERKQNLYSKTELENTFENAKERVRDFFSDNTEARRSALLRVMDRCLIFGHYILIETKGLLSVFDVRNDNSFNKKLLSKLKDDKVFKEHYIEAMTPDKFFIDVDYDAGSYMKSKIYKIGETAIIEYNLKGVGKKFNEMAVKEIFKELKIDFDFSKKNGVLFFGGKTK